MPETSTTPICPGVKVRRLRGILAGSIGVVRDNPMPGWVDVEFPCASSTVMRLLHRDELEVIG